jgi:hypothetical protein
MRLPARTLTLLLCLLCPALLHAQHATASRLPTPVTAGLPAAVAAQAALSRTATTATESPAYRLASVIALDTAGGPASAVGLLAAGLLAAGASAAAGAALGYNVDRSGPSGPTGDDPGLGGLVVGWVLAPALITPGAVHLVNGQHGSLGAGYAAAAVIAGIGLVTAHAGPPTPVAVALVVGAPVLQAASAAIMERRTRRPRD